MLSYMLKRGRVEQRCLEGGWEKKRVARCRLGFCEKSLELIRVVLKIPIQRERYGFSGQSNIPIERASGSKVEAGDLRMVDGEYHIHLPPAILAVL